MSTTKKRVTSKKKGTVIKKAYSDRDIVLTAIFTALCIVFFVLAVNH